jgi:DNA-binding response OmpR family regulator
VLLVEAHADTRDLYALWLRDRDFRVEAAASADDALAVGGREAPDIVVTELMLPGGGPSLIRALRAQPATADALIVVLTTQTALALRAETLAAGADVYVVKPCGAPRLGKILVLGSRTRLQQSAPVGASASRHASVRAAHRSFAVRERIPRHVDDG